MYENKNLPYHLVDPEVVAVYGVVPDLPERAGTLIYQRLEREGHKVLAVNPKEKNLLSGLGDTSEKIDLAILAVSNRHLEPALNDCITKEVKSVLVFSDYIIPKKIKGDGPRILGPNSLGFFKPDTHLDTMFVSQDVLNRPGPGNIGMISQSGFIALPLFEALSARSLGISLFIDVGSKYDIDEIDALSYLREDEATDVIALYLEDMDNGRVLYECAREMKKSMVLLKGGRTKQTSEAVKSHTGTISQGSDTVLKGAAKQSGIVIARDESEFVDFAVALSRNRSLMDNKIAVISTSGATGVVGADAVALSSTLALSELSDETVRTIKNNIPFIERENNPIDLSPRVNNREYSEILRILVEAEEVSGVMAYLSSSPNMTKEAAEGIQRIYESTDKPMIFVFLGEIFSGGWRKEFFRRGMDTYPSTRSAVRVLEALLRSVEHV
ncbi:MAG: CoA-binding protein [Thermoplasmata archaeon]